MSKPSGNDIVLGRGEIRVDAEDANEKLTGERFFGDCPSFPLAASTENTEVYSSTGPIREKIADITTQVNRSASLTCQNISMPNLALFLMGDVSETSQGSGSVSDERPVQNPVQGGKWYQAGQTATDPVGAMDISNFTMTIDPDGTSSSATEGTDYEVRPKTGDYYIIPGGAADGETISVSYDKAETTWDLLKTVDDKPITGALRFIGKNARGSDRNIYIPKMTLAPDGDLPWISAQDVMQLSLSMRIGKRGDMSQVYVNGRPA